jgi:hypothetical protein
MRIAARLFPRALVSASGFSSPFLSRFNTAIIMIKEIASTCEEKRALSLSLPLFRNTYMEYRHLTIYTHAYMYLHIRKRKKNRGSRCRNDSHERLRFYETSNVMCRIQQVEQYYAVSK